MYFSVRLCVYMLIYFLSIYMVVSVFKKKVFQQEKYYIETRYDGDDAQKLMSKVFYIAFTVYSSSVTFPQLEEYLQKYQVCFHLYGHLVHL